MKWWELGLCLRLIVCKSQMLVACAAVCGHGRWAGIHRNTCDTSTSSIHKTHYQTFTKHISIKHPQNTSRIQMLTHRCQPLIARQLCLYACVHIHACVHVHVHACVHVHVHACVHVHAHACVHRACMPVYTFCCMLLLLLCGCPWN